MLSCDWLICQNGLNFNFIIFPKSHCFYYKICWKSKDFIQDNVSGGILFGLKELYFLKLSSFCFDFGILTKVASLYRWKIITLITAAGISEINWPRIRVKQGIIKKVEGLSKFSAISHSSWKKMQSKPRKLSHNPSTILKHYCKHLVGISETVWRHWKEEIVARI